MALAIVSLIVGVASLIFGGFAIWLSAVLYGWGSEAQERIRLSADRVEKAVGGLDIRVHGLQTDALGMVRETLSDMRKRLLEGGGDTNLGGAEASAAERSLEREIASLREDLVAEIAALFQSNVADQASLRLPVEAALRRSAGAGLSARDSVAREAIVAHLAAHGQRDGLSAAELMGHVGEQLPFSAVVRALEDLKAAGYVIWAGRLGPDSRISLLRRDDVVS
jgi:hypothetical protein